METYSSADVVRQLTRAVDRIRSASAALEVNRLIGDILAKCAVRYADEVETSIRAGYGPIEEHRPCGRSVPQCDCIRSELRLAEFY